MITTQTFDKAEVLPSNAFRTFDEFFDRYKNFLTLEYADISGRVLVTGDQITLQAPTTVLDAFVDAQKIQIPLPERYRYRPEHLSLLLYGIVDLWSILLLVNDCRNHKEFNKETIFIADPSMVKEYSNIVSKSSKFLKGVIHVKADDEFHPVLK